MEQPLKRLRRRNRDGQMSAKHTSNNPVTKTPLISPKEEYAEFPESVAENIMVKSEPETGQSTPATCHSLDHNKGKQPVVHETSDPVQKSGVDGSHQSTPLRPEPVHPMRLRDRGTGSVTSRIPSKKKKPVTTECSSRDVRLEELKVEFLSSTEKISARRVLIKPKDDPITDDNLEAPIEVTHLDPLNGGNPSSRDDSIKKDYGREPTIRSRNQLKTANGTASSNEPRNKGKVAMPLASDSNGKVDGSELNKMDTRVESQSVNGKKEINAKLINKNRVTPETIKSLDIAKGQEKVVITMANEVNDERPPHFYYIPRNAIFENAYVNVSLARIGDVNSCANCDGDCLSLETPCVCSYETGGEFAYTADGLVKEELLKESISMNRDPEKHCQFFCKECPLERSKNEDTVEPCKGHLVRKFIKECWLKCGCDQLCGNRVVQRGISRKLQVFMTPGGKGWGLRTLEDLPEGAFVCEYVGEVLTNAELFDRVLRKPKGEKHSYPVLLDADWCVEGVLKDEDALCLDATYYGNVARFINHRCHDSNLVEIPVEVETPDHHYYHLAFFTTRKVKAMEELTWDYGIDFDDTDHPIKAFRCQCGSKFCRNIKRSRSRRIKRW